MASSSHDDITQAAARLVVEEGLEYGLAKRKAARNLARRQVRAADLPSNEQVEDEVREYLAIFLADSQPSELAALRRLAGQWMERLAEFRPHLAGAVWRGTATRRSAVQLELYCDDPKSAEIALLNLHVDYEVGGNGNQTDLIRLEAPCRELGQAVPLFLWVLDRDDLRGALKPDSRGRNWRGDLAALNRLMLESPP
jgi:hypothetical protein